MMLVFMSVSTVDVIDELTINYFVTSFH